MPFLYGSCYRGAKSYLFETLQPGFSEILLGAAKEKEGMQSSLGTEINV